MEPEQHEHLPISRREEEVQFRLLAENAQDVAIFLMDPEGYITTWNLGAERMKGWKAEEAIGQHYRILYLPEDIAAGNPEQHLAQARETGKYEDKAWRRRKDGSKFWGQLILTALYDDAGALHGFAKITQDRTGEWKAETELERRAQEREELLARELAARQDVERERDLVGRVMENAPLAIGVLEGPEYRFALANPATVELVGAPEHSFLGRPHREVVPEADPMVGPILDRVFQSGQPEVVPELEVKLPDDKCACVHATFTPLPGADGKPGAVLYLALDTTELRSAQHALRLSEARFRAIFDQVTVGIGQMDPTGRFLMVNQRLCDIFGRASEELLETRTQEVTHPEDRPRYAALFERLVRERQHFVIEKRCLCPQGNCVWVNCSVAPILDSRGDVESVVAVVEDITERKQAEAAVRGQQVWLEEVLDRLPTPLVFLDPDRGGVTFANRAAREMAGGELAPGIPVEDYDRHFHVTDQHGERLPNDRFPAARVARGERVEQAETVWHLPSGPVALLLNGEMIPAAHGHPPVGLLMFQDITRIKQVEAELREAGKRKDEFLAMLAHELRNPLGAIRNAVAVLQQAEPDSPPFRRNLEVVKRQIRHQSQIVDDLLDLSRLTRGKMELRVETLDLVQVVRDVVDDFRRECETKSLTLLLDVPEDPVPVRGDATRLSQVLANLLHNACKFTPDGERVAIDLAFDRTAPQVALRVRDTGVGIAADLLPRLFEPFSQGDRTLDRAQGGLGLGLAIVRGLVEMHGGAVRASSDGEGKGAEFTVTLPLDPEAASGLSRRSAFTPAARRLRVLLIEDNADAADTMRDLLELSGYEVEVAYTGPSGIAAAEQFGPEVIFCDIGLPGMDGYTVAERLRGNSRTARAHMVALTGYGREEDRRRSEEAGFDMHLTKPADPRKLNEVLTTVARARRG